MEIQGTIGIYAFQQKFFYFRAQTYAILILAASSVAIPYNIESEKDLSYHRFKKHCLQIFITESH